MADKPFRCRLITPEARVFDSDVAYVSVPMWDGKAGFMSGASAMVGRLGYGELRVEFVDRYEAGVKVQEAGNKRWYVDGGFMQNVANELTILANGAVEADKLSRPEAEAQLAAASGRSSIDPKEMERITEDRQRARARLAVLSGM